jgi:hypothetical protein
MGGVACVGCSSSGETPFDGGEPDGFSSEDSGPPLFAEDSASMSSHDGGDATISPSGEDSGQAPQPDSASPDSGTAADSALDSTTSGQDSSTGPIPDSSLPDTSEPKDTGPVDATTALCASYNESTNPIDQLAASTSSGVVLNIATTDPTQNPVPANESVMVTVQTAPIGIMNDVSVAYQPAGAANPTFVPMTVSSSTGSVQVWSGAIPPLPAGEAVAFWVQGHDVCGLAADAGPHYYSNSSANYHYETVAAEAGAADSGIPDAGPSEDASDSATPFDSGNTGSEDSGSAEDATRGPDSSDGAATDSAADVENDAPSCVASCATALTFLGVTSAYAMGTPVTLTGGTVPAGESLTAVTQTYPKGTAASVHVVYATNSSFTGASDVTMTFDTNQPNPNNDQWYGIIPAQASKATVYWYLQADGCDCSSTLYDPGNFMNYTYTQE